MISVAATLVVVAMSVVGWWFYGQWRTGRVELLTEGDPVVVQVLAEDSDAPIGEPFDLATRAVVELPDGDYRLRVNGKGRLGRTFRVAVNRGETLEHSVSIDEGRLLGGEPESESPHEEKRLRRIVDREDDRNPRPRASLRWPIPFAKVTTALELTPGKADLIEWTDKSLVRRDGTTGNVIWDALHPAKPFESDRDPASLLSRDFGSRFFQSGFLEGAPDLNRDGTGDVILFSRQAAAIVALSGSDGSMLWNSLALDDGSGGPRRDEVDLGVLLSMSGSTAGEPAVADVDGDGTLDLIAAFRFADVFEKRPGKLIVMGISGRSGRRLWSFTIESPAAARPATATNDRRCSCEERTRCWSLLSTARSGPVLTPRRGSLLPDRSTWAAIRWCRCNMPTWTATVNPRFWRLGPGRSGKQRTLQAFSIKSGRELWSVTVGRAYYEKRDDPALLPAITRWSPISTRTAARKSWFLTPARCRRLRNYRGVRLIDGRTGETALDAGRWDHEQIGPKMDWPKIVDRARSRRRRRA